MQTNFAIEDYGAVGDGATLNTAAFQQAVDACHAAGGGRVIVGAGRYLTGTVTLKSRVDLHLTAGARIVGSTRIEDYEAFDAPGYHIERSPEKCSHTLFRAADAEQIAITGSGVIDGSGRAFYNTAERAWGVFYAKPANPRPRMLTGLRCRDVVLEGVQFNESPCWTVWLMDCDRVRIRGIQMHADQAMINNDGLDIDACRDVVVSDCIFQTGDDCIAVRNMRQLRDAEGICENVTVSNCLLDSWCQGIRVGCPSDGVIRNVRFSNLQITSRSNGITLEYPERYLAPDGVASADVSNLFFANIGIRCGNTPINVTVAESIELKRLGGLHFSNVDIASGKPIRLVGSPKTVIDGVQLSQVRMVTEAPEPLVVQHCRNLVMDNTSLSAGVPGAAYRIEP
jgi:polygalacturonase